MKDDQTPSLPVGEILGRLQELHQAKSETQLAGVLGVRQSTLASWKQRGSIPFGVLLQAAEQMNVTLDWLVYGRGAAMPGFSGDVEKDVLAIAIRAALQPEIKDERISARIEDDVYHYYFTLQNMLAGLIASGIEPAQARKTVEGVAKNMHASGHLRKLAKRD